MTKYRPVTNQEAHWAISRMARIVRIWDQFLTVIDKEFILRRIRDTEPELFQKIFYER